MSAPQKIIQLVENFDNNIRSYKHTSYNETQARQEYINPFFKSLGWDVDNEQGLAEAYKDVIHEDIVKIGTATKSPDYSFRIGGTRKFFVEAKKPSVDIETNVQPAYQLRRYAWSAKLPLSILTDFEEFAVYDCRLKPNLDDKASTSRIMLLKFNDYVDKWDSIYEIFSKDAILKGNYDKFAETSKGKRGTSEVDDEFLKEIEEWRDILARNIAIRNANLTNRELNTVVQNTIDRLIFLRICEDRAIEEYGQLQTMLNGTNVYRRIVEIYYKADQKYNSGLFHFIDEKSREAPDTISTKIEIDDKPLKDIIKRLYYPESPYEFSVIPVEILGNVYERFLGKVIRLTAGHQAKIEEKPEVRKAGGVYYTPKYIVDYIVENTVGKLLENKTIEEADKLKICDPACGSGSFLLGAYRNLLDWHSLKYTEKPDKFTKGKNPPIYQTKENEYRLTIQEKKRILLNNIYGVDIDAQAVEVTKLSLLLKALEGETDQTLKSLELFHERALPDLSNNIKCGNSLIGPDFYDGKEQLFDMEEQIKVNAFDWEKEFSEVFKAGGFDTIIGNPPYGADIQDIKYITRKFPNSSNMKEINSFIYFIENSIRLLRKSGKLGFIIPDTMLSKIQYYNFRYYLFNSVTIEEIVETGAVFEQAVATPNIIIIIKNLKPNLNDKILRRIVDFRKKISELLNDINLGYFLENGFLSYQEWGESYLYSFGKYINKSKVALINKMNKNRKLNELEYLTINRGLEGGKNSLQQKGKYQILIPDNIERYITFNSNKFINDYHDSFTKERILIIRIRSLKISKRIIASYENQNRATLKTLQQIYFDDQSKINLKFILGIINSNLINFYCSHYLIDDINKKYLEQLPVPIPQPPFPNPQHDRIVSLVEQMLELNKKVRTLQGHEKTVVERQIESTDRQIDKLVYELYGLTEDEIKVVEG